LELVLLFAEKQSHLAVNSQPRRGFRPKTDGKTAKTNRIHRETVAADLFDPPVKLSIRDAPRGLECQNDATLL